MLRAIETRTGWGRERTGPGLQHTTKRNRRSREAPSVLKRRGGERELAAPARSLGWGGRRTDGGDDEEDEEGVEDGDDGGGEGRDDVAQGAHAAEEADDAEGAHGAEHVDGHADGAERDEGERDDDDVAGVPAVGEEGAAPVGVGVDGELHGEDDGEEGVEVLEVRPGRGGRAVAVGEGGDELGLGGVDEEVLRRGCRRRASGMGERGWRMGYIGGTDQKNEKCHDNLEDQGFLKVPHNLLAP